VTTGEAASFGIDTGGTLTDIVAVAPGGKIYIKKVDNGASDPTHNIVSGVTKVLSEAGLREEQAGRLVHCTTLLGNAVIQRVGPVCGLITTRGFRDVLELRRQRNPVLYDVFWKKPPPLIPRSLCVEVTERVGADGSIVTPLDLADARKALRKLKAAGVESVAICLINSCVNATHEMQLADLIRAEYPDMDVSISSQISPEWGEYERTSTSVTNAFVKPIFRRYIGAFQRKLEDNQVRPSLFIMQSAGGVVPASMATELPVQCLDSGPAATVIAASRIGSFLGIRNAVTLEIGGTTAKSTIIEDGEPRRAHESEIATPIGSDGRSLRGGGYALRIPVIDLAEVGAGGGSIAAVDVGGSLSVGPEGAGAFPGPACYGRGGTRPTLTDANLVLGCLSSDFLLGGTIKLRPELASKALEEHVARPLGIPVLEAAYAVRTLANAVMARAIRAVTTERGRDARRFALLAAGGGGPGHAAEVARQLDIATVVIPPLAGLFSALGLLWSPPEQHYSQACRIALADPDSQHQVASILSDLQGRIRESVGSSDVDRLMVFADVHYVGQFHDLTVPVSDRDGQLDLSGVRAAFEAEHERTYGYASPEEEVELRAIRVVLRHKLDASGDQRAEAFRQLAASLYVATAKNESREVYFGPKFGALRAQVLSRGDLTEAPLSGPLVIPEYDTTIIVPPDFSAHRDTSGCVILKRIA